MKRSTPDRITFFMAASAVVLAIGTTLVAGVDAGLGAVAGGLVAVTNWLVLEWLVRRTLRAPESRRAGVMLLLVAKMGALMALSWVIVAELGVHPVGFIVGLTALFLGILAGASLGGAAEAREGSSEDEHLAGEDA